MFLIVIFFIVIFFNIIGQYLNQHTRSPLTFDSMGSISSISYKGGHEKWIQHLKQEAIDPATQQETICGCSFLKNGNDIKTMCLIDVIIQSGASGLQECKDTCQKLDNGAMIKFGTLMTSALPVIPGLCCNTMYNIDIGDIVQGGYKYCQPKQNAETKRRVFEYKKEFARNAALIMAEKAAAIQNGQDPSLVKIEVEVEVEVVPQQATEIDPDMVAKELAEKIRIEQEKKQEQQQEEQQKQQQKQEEEQQKHEDAEAVAAAAALPTPPIDEYIYNELKFAHKGPLGLKLVPNTLPFTIESQSHNLLPGDEMTLINGEDVLDCETSDEIMEILIEASYPKTIQFRRKVKKKVIKSIEDIAEERAAKGFLYLTEPPLLHGYKIPFSVAEFGKLRRASLSNVSDIENDDANKDIQNFCDPSRNTIKIRVAVPIDGCQTARPYQRSTNATHTDTSIVYAMVKRGACPFTKKAETIEKAGYNGIILFNNDLNQELIRMPAKRNFKTKEIIPINFNGHAVMIDSMNGALLHTSILTGSTPTKQLFLNMQGIFKTNECISHQLEMFATPSIWMKKIDQTTELQKNKNIKFTDTQGNTRDVVKDNEKSLAMIEKSNVVPDGHLIMWNGNKHSRTLPVVIAGFGEIDYQKLIHLPPSRVILGIPEDGCDDKGFSNSVKGAWVIVKRGGCSFVEKVRNIQNVGGTAALIINTRKKPYLFEMPMGPEGAPDLIIPVLQIPMDSVMEIEYMKYEGVNILGRVDWNRK